MSCAALAKVLATVLATAAALGLAACERGASDAASGRAAEAAGRPYAELTQVAAVVREARAILPRLPADAALPPISPPDADQAPEPRRVLLGEGRLLRPGAFPELPPRMQVEVFLDHRRPPGGHLRITNARGTRTWPVLDAVVRGERDAAFAITLRVSDPAARLRYLVLLGVPYEAGGRGYRALEGYLIHPTPAGGVAPTGPVYPVDFGYRHPEPPEPVVRARALAERIEALRTTFAEWEARQARLAELQSAAERLRDTDVPPEQAARRREDLRDYARRITAAESERDQAAETLRRGLERIYRGRVALAEAWLAFTETNAWRWRTPGSRRRAYLPLQTLRAQYPALERIHTALDADRDPALRDAREAMEEALLREQERAPTAG